MRKLFLILVLAAASFLPVTYSQAIGDYRSANTGNWNDPNTWEKYSAAGWVLSNDYPTAATATKVNIESGHTITLNAPLTLKFLVLNGGIVSTTSANLLTIHYQGSITGGSAASFIDGPMAAQVSVAAGVPKELFLPLGKDGIGRPAKLKVGHNRTNLITYTIEMFNTAPGARTLPANLSSVSSVRYYTVNRTNVAGVTSSGTITLSYDTDDGVGNTNSLLRVVKDNGAAWQDLGGSGTAPVAGSITSTTTTTFLPLTNSIFALASSYCSISGSTGVGGATLNWFDGTLKTTTSAANGAYTVYVPADWSGSVTPSLQYYNFTPTEKTYTNVNANIANENYTAVSIFKDFRTTGPGDWNDPLIWEGWDGTAWVPSSVPTGAAGTIEILADHEVYLNLVLVIDSGAILNNKGIFHVQKSLTVKAGAIIVNEGTMDNPNIATPPSENHPGSLHVYGTYEHRQDGGKIGIENSFGFTGTYWYAGSKCLVTGMVSAAPLPWANTSLANMVWDCPNQSTDAFLNINSSAGYPSGKDYYYSFGNLTVLNSNGNNVYMFSGQGRSLGDIIIDGANSKATIFSRASTGIEYLFFSYINSITVKNSGQLFLCTQPGTNNHYPSINLRNSLIVSDGVFANYSNSWFTGESFARVIFSGSTTQSVDLSGLVPVTGMDENTNNLNFFVSNNLTLLSPITLKNLAVNAKINSNSNLITILPGGVVTGGSNNNFINGRMSYQVATSNPVSLLFPLGKGSAGRPVTLNVKQNNNTLTTYTAEMLSGSLPANQLPTSLNVLPVNWYYNISKGAGANLVNASLSVNYYADDNIGNNNKILRLVKDDGSGNWINLGGMGSAASFGSITSFKNFNSLSNFTMAYTSFAADLIAYWKLEEEAGNSYADLTEINNGTGNQSPIKITGLVNNAQQFNGANTKINAIGNPSFDLLPNGNLSVEFWFKGSNVPTSTKVIVSRFISPTIYWWVGLNANDGKAKFTMVNSGVNATITGSIITDGNWHHVTATRNGTTNELKLYVDGILQNTLVKSFAAGFISATAKLEIGSLNNNYVLDGALDEVALHNSVLTQAEIQQHYNVGLLGGDYYTKIVPAITSTPLLTGKENKLYTYDVDASGNPVPYYRLTTAPVGMIIDSLSGILQWTPADSGSFNVTVEAINGFSSPAVQSFVIVVEPAQIIPQGLISYWKLNEPGGNTYLDFYEINNAVGNVAPQAVSGQVNGAQLFNGTNTKLNVPANSSLDFTASGSFSVEFWYKGTTVPTATKVVVSRYISSSLYWWVGLNANDGKAKFVMIGGGINGTLTGGVITDGNWHHVLATRNGTTNELSLFVDGILKSTVNKVFPVDFSSPTAKLEIGSLSNNYVLDGSLDEIALHNVALTHIDVQQHYSAGIASAGYYDPIAPSITSTPVISAAENVDYSYDINATGNPVPKYRLLTFPEGMTIDSLSGLILWTPTTAGIYTVVAEAFNGVTPAAIDSFDINVDAAIVMPAGVISYWKLDEVSGTAFADYLGGKTGTASVAPAPVAGIVNGAQNFNGTNTRIIVPANPVFDFSAAGNFSAEFWFKGNTIPTATKIAVSRFISGSVYWSIGLNASTGKVRFNMVSGGVNATAIGTPITDGNWHHVTATRNGTTGELKIYVDGLLKGTAVKAYTVDFISPTAKLEIGSLNNSYVLNGSLDEIAIHSVTLSPEEILNHYNNGLAGQNYWNLAKIAAENIVSVPSDYKIGSNYPNPFNPSTSVDYELPMDSRISISVYNVIGEKVSDLVNEIQSAGYYKQQWNAGNLASGMYLLRIEAKSLDGSKDFVKTLKMMLLK